ncbi:MAG: prepilin-type N-terminal cleavage/methylation domain-containing protein, partial [Kiritimatiellae bacterium]|nr:prepilin-type N-terminal cleavage/methylation domain-containing protein [Kiritimatiellia bacterium]
MNRNGFTLIELIIVIAILGFVTVVGIHSYGNVREVQAKKVNLANIKRVYSALSTYEMLNREQGASGYFGGFDSLIDAASSGSWRGGEGTFDLGTRTETTGRGSTSATFDAR